MKSNRKALFSFLILIMVIPFMVNLANSQTYYEWIQNKSFDDGLVQNNQLLNYGFESSLTSWDIVSQEGTYNFGNATFAYEGSKSLVIERGGETNFLSISQNFSEVALGSVNEISLYWKGGHLGSPYNNGWLDMYIQYNYTEEFEFQAFLIAYENTSSSWTKTTIPNELLSDTLDIGGGHFATNCKLLGIVIALNDNADSWISIDNVVVSTSSSVTQSVVNTGTTPWYCYFGVALPNPTIVTDTANSGVYSCLFTKGSGGYYNTLIQNIENLPSSNVYSLTIYALDASGSGGGQIQVKIQYSDGTYDYSSFALTGSWIQYDFTSIVTDGKTIVKILIKPIDLSGSYIYIDDVSLLSTEVTHITTFHLSMNPTTLWITDVPSGFSNMGFGQYLNIDEYANLTILRDGIVNATGSFNATSSKGILSGSVTNGSLYFGISARTGLSNNTKETFTINIQSDNFNGTTYIDAYWYNITTTTPTVTDNGLIDTIVVIIIPAFVYGGSIFIGLYVTKWKFVGLLIGVNVGTLIYLFIPNTALWVLPLTILIDVVLIIFRPKGE